jgi:hypothetical protein
VTDAQIVNSKASAPPAVYTLPAAIEFVLKAVNADFDGSAAASSYLPAVVISSDSAHVIVRAVDPANPVAAGGSAEASFFPGVKTAASSVTPPGGTAPAHAGLSTHDADPDQTVPGAAAAEIKWYNFRTSDTSIFGTSASGSSLVQTNAAGNSGLLLKAAGLYHFQLAALWIPGATNVQTYAWNGGGVDAHNVTRGRYRDLATLGPSGFLLWTYDVLDVVVATTPQALYCIAENSDTSNHDLLNAYLSLSYFPIATPETTIFGS